MAVSRQKKAEVLTQLNDCFARQKATVFLGYRGTTVKDVTALRNAARQEGMSYHVVKKNLIKMTAKEQTGAEIQDVLFDKQPFGTLFSYEDQVSSCKLAAKFAKDLNTISILGGVIDGVAVSSDVILQYSKLPSREELLAKFTGLVRAPLTGFHGLIKTSISSFARSVSELAKQKETA